MSPRKALSREETAAFITKASQLAAEIRNEFMARRTERDPILFCAALKIAVELELVHVAHDFGAPEFELRQDLATLDRMVDNMSFQVETATPNKKGITTINRVVEMPGKPEGKPS